ncbi:MAG: 5-formyltetrahydrofolate cyclo-ligase [Candidatus Aenigmarchaeota archaeon]|nr:5-formyltetrahydrofolate cyclo-ligase [Candidatus Aenigmarchaeota archaeon]MDW8149142.1 5-formyltetrahydrofolate cyclo-ligase [Candidatus Aenigmarchaeota archaeon]
MNSNHTFEYSNRRKQELRKFVWSLMEKNKVVKFPGAFNRIPNFIGSEKAAEKALEIDDLKKAKVVKANPDLAQKPLRELCLKLGKIVYMAVPKLKQEKCFIELNPKNLKGLESYASTINGAFKYGKIIYPTEMEKIDVMIVGCVAVNRKGAKVGKGGGYSDLEYAIGREFGIISEKTCIITTVHPLQIISEEIPMEKHDICLDWIVTENEIIKTENFYQKPKGIYWDILSKEKIESIPILKKLKSNTFNFN